MPTSPGRSSLSRRDWLGRMAQSSLACSLLGSSASLLGAAEAIAPSPAPTPALKFTGPWRFHLPKASIILVSDQQLEDLTDPDREVDLSLSSTPNRTTLRKFCRDQQAAGVRTVIVAFDEFWSQYRPGQAGKPRQFMPDTQGYLDRISRIGQVLRAHNLGMELSLLSPLELGRGFTEATGESGRWVHYREGWRDPRTGEYVVEMWEQTRWTNNKGTIEPVRAGVRAFAFRERRVGGTRFYAVDPGDIVELNQAPEITAFDAEDPKAHQRRLRVHGRGDLQAGPRDRVLVVVSYTTPELDYFSPKALPFLEELVARYHRAEVPLDGLYADEIHIQGDWRYFDHHDEGQYALRYLTASMARRFAEMHGPEFADLERFLVYFCVGQHAFLPGLQPRLEPQHVMGGSPDDIQKTWLLRRRYFDLLEKTVVDLFVRSKASAERLYGHELDARAHATWAQSPTIDYWQTGEAPLPPRQYEYTSDFVWSNTVHQAASACSDYFRWNEFLTGGGNDHAEGGWSDRNYYGLALACSTGILNRVPNAYAAAWGLPAAAQERRRALENAYGCAPDPAFAAIQDFAHRDVPVLMIYPSSLVACDERFGSWMTQYGYANYVTAEKLLERGRVSETDGWIEMAGRRFGTIAVLFEPLPAPELLPFLESFTAGGGRLIWSGPPPRLDLSGSAVLERWKRLVGVQNLRWEREGLGVAGSTVHFDNALRAVPPQTVLTDFLVDRAYLVDAAEGVECVARIAGSCVGTLRSVGKGRALYLGFRPRDDQAASLGDEVRTWFEILRAFGSYPGSGKTPGTSDDPSVISRDSEWLATQFPNGTLCLAAHYRRHVENWPGGFHRDAAKDEAILRGNPLPPETLEIRDLAIAGQRIKAYQGRRLLALRTRKGRDQTELEAFAGYDCRSVEVGDRKFEFAAQPLPFLAWAPVSEERRVNGGALAQLWIQGTGRVRIPLPDDAGKASRLAAMGALGTLGAGVPGRFADGYLEIEAAWPNHPLELAVLT
ncbi:MAG: hypothetical protein IT581_20935 [Verrucomicrobiales bacterium]|nr:hypothetical protein [Verrucomicrobiales bacterium]